MKYKLIVVDMDGTLLSNQHNISQENKKVIKEVMSKGIKVAIATGRIYTSAKFYAQLIGTAAPIIACNGALIRNHYNDEIVYCDPMNKKAVIDIAKICKENNIYFHFYDKENFYLEELKYASLKYQDWNLKQKEESQVNLVQLKDSVSFLQENDIAVLKINIMDEDMEKLEKVKRIISKIDTVEVNKSWYNNIEAMNKGVSKGKGIKALGKLLGIKKEEIIAFGDNYNDLSMKDYAGTFVAMGNGEDYVKQQADYITDSNDLDGVAKGIKKLVLGEEEL